jgi:hypothetical protein
MSSQPSEPHNPFYLLLLVASVLFVATALGYGVVPVLEEKSRATPRRRRRSAKPCGSTDRGGSCTSLPP